jgi:hypothetical protein
VLDDTTEIDIINKITDEVIEAYEFEHGSNIESNI